MTTSTQVIQAIDNLLGTRAYRLLEAQTTEWATDARESVWKTLRTCCPCSACGGTGIDESKPWDPRTLLTGQNCDTCQGNGFELEDGNYTAIFEHTGRLVRDYVQALYGGDLSGDDIRAGRERLGLTRQAMAEALGALGPERTYSSSIVYMWETGRRNPDPYSRQTLLRLFAQSGN